MLLPRARSALGGPSTPAGWPSTSVLDAFRALALHPPNGHQVRHATHAAEGRANGVKDGAGKRLGAKKSSGEYVTVGNILFRQRGTKWHAGDNVGLGRDHTLFALQPGYVRYYRDPNRHPDKKYIGVALKQDEVLPRPRNAARSRRLGMIAVPIRKDEGMVGDLTTMATQVRRGETKVVENERTGANEKAGGLVAKGQATRMANWQIGRVADKVRVKQFVPGDRFLAWRKRAEKQRIAREKRGLRRGTKAKK